MRSKILVTIGPAIRDERIFSKVKSMVDGIRINSAHDNPEIHSKVVDMVRRLSDLPIMIDLKGPEVRLASEKYEFKPGEFVKIYGEKELGEPYFTKNIIQDLKPGATLLVADGKLILEVKDVKENYIIVEAKTHYVLSGGKNLAVRGDELKSLEDLSKRDLQYIELSKEFDIEFVALSFARYPEVIRKLRKMLPKNTEIIAKIEDSLGVKNFNKILEEADGVMIARGDLALNVGFEEVPALQKRMIEEANKKGKLSIVATQVLESMIENPYPTRAEVSDIFNSIIDGADAIMLSGETSIGKYPIRAIEVLRETMNKAEEYIREREYIPSYRNVSEIISHAVKEISKKYDIDRIIAVTRTGFTAKMISRFRLRQQILSVCEEKKVYRTLKLYYGVKPFYIGEIREHASPEIIKKVVQELKDYLDPEEIILFVAGVKTSRGKESNMIEIHKVEDLLSYFGFEDSF